MRALDILKSEGRLRREAFQRNLSVNGRYLILHNVLAQAFRQDLSGVSNTDLPDYLSAQLSLQPSCPDSHGDALAA